MIGRQFRAFSVLIAVATGCGILSTDPAIAVTAEIAPTEYRRSDPDTPTLQIRNTGDDVSYYHLCSTFLERRVGADWERRSGSGCNDMPSVAVPPGETKSSEIVIDDGLYVGEHRVVVLVTGGGDRRYVASNSYWIVDE